MSEHEQILVADEGEIAPAFGDLGVKLGLLGLGQPANVAVERGEVEIPVQGTRIERASGAHW
jgi:hypothetical protein